MFLVHDIEDKFVFGPSNWKNRFICPSIFGEMFSVHGVTVLRKWLGTPNIWHMLCFKQHVTIFVNAIWLQGLKNIFWNLRNYNIYFFQFGGTRNRFILSGIRT